MATTTVFVDDAVRGRLPEVCAKTGVPATRHLTIHQDLTGGLGAAWVLVFFGPLGWLVLALVAVSRRRSTLTVRIPYADRELDRYVRTARRTFHLAIATGVLLLAVFGAAFGLALSDPSPLVLAGLAVLVLGGVAVLVNGMIARRMLVGVGLDASGRWVLLSRVHPAFAAACHAVPVSTPGRLPA
ncbi:MAG TPA: hypothetical protein VNQ33_03580 [Acidimicrobiales bacterium]|nr:hypothetical protein [Acidimicrobiales bacterium]